MRRYSKIFALSSSLTLPIFLFNCKKDVSKDSSSTTSATQVSDAGPYYGAEMRTKNGYGMMDKALRVTWRAKPAKGNCSITLLSLFNADRIFSTNQGAWSEITFEIFNGAATAPYKGDFQTQFITRASPNAPATQRGKGHDKLHKRGGNVPNVWDGKFHDFQVEWMPSTSDNAYLAFFIDGKEIRREKGGDLKFLEGNLDIYSAAWMSKKIGQPNSWGCVDNSPRIASTALILDNFKVEQQNGKTWGVLEERSFANAADIQAFDLSDWSFESFDGKYCPANVVHQAGSEIRLELDKKCGPG